MSAPLKSQSPNPLARRKHSNVGLPPVRQQEKEQLALPNKRNLQFNAGDENTSDRDKIIPTKSRKLNASSNRVVSLTNILKPALSPPEATQSYQSIIEGINQTPSPQKPTTTPSNDMMSPLKYESTPKPKIRDLRRQETALDMQIRKSKTRIETLKRAKNILTNTESTSNAELIDKWRDVTQKASNYLLNAAVDKVNKTGGKQEFLRREREQLRESLEYTIDSSFQDRVSEITGSEEFDNLPAVEQERILEDLDKQQELTLKEAEKSIIQDDHGGDDVFTMRDLYKRLKLNYKLAYPASDSD